jgi:hypothetical protein
VSRFFKKVYKFIKKASETLFIFNSVPLKQSIENLLNIIPQKSLNYSSKYSTGEKTDIFDGEEIRNKLKNKDSLALAFYVDDAEVANPVGTNTKKHKLSKYSLIIQY